MKKTLIGICTVVLLYIIFAAKIEMADKNLIVAVICTALMGYYLVKSIRAGLRLPNALIVIFPTIALLGVSILSRLQGWNVPTLTLWGGYIVLTLFSFVVSARIGMSDDAGVGSRR